MSQQRNQLKVYSKKPYCKVCHDAGKSEQEYTSHYVRSTPSPLGKVICPTLLAIECRNCYQLGHTIKFCPSISHQAKMAREMAYRTALEQPPQQKAKATSTNIFAALDSDDEDEKKEKKQKKQKKEEQFPALMPKWSRSKTIVGYAAAAAALPVSISAKKAETNTACQEGWLQLEETPFPKAFPEELKGLKPTVNNWADYEDDEDNDDDNLDYKLDQYNRAFNEEPEPFKEEPEPFEDDDQW